MCSYTNSLRPYVAEEDLRVFKILVERKVGDKVTYATPYTNTPCELNNTLKAKTLPDDVLSFPCTTSKYYAIGEGYIHAATAPNINWWPSATIGNDAYGTLFEAIIPKGAKYLIDNDMVQVCSTELFITDREVDCSATITREEWLKIVKPILNRIDRTQVSVGWIYLKDGTFVHPLHYQIKLDSVVGIVAKVGDGECVIMNPTMERGHFRLQSIPAIIDENNYEWSLPTPGMLKRTMFGNVDIMSCVSKVIGCKGYYGCLKFACRFDNANKYVSTYFDTPDDDIPYTAVRFTRIRRN